MRELRFERDLAVPIDVAWRWVTEPELMNRWSEAKISGGTSQVRSVSVRLFGLTSRLSEEIIERSPPRRFVYRVVGHPVIRDHLGTLDLSAQANGTTLVWTVRFRGVIPGLSALLEAILKPSLGRSLDTLVTLVEEL